MTREEILLDFDPNCPGDMDANIFGLPFPNELCDIIIIPVPWEVTVSYGSGAASGPQHIVDASFQVDLYHPQFPDMWKKGIGMDEIPEHLIELGQRMRLISKEIIDGWANGENPRENEDLKFKQATVNAACEEMNNWVRERSKFWKNNGKKVGLLGGDHSTPLGFYETLGQQYGNFGILHIDAHMDLRIAYEGFTYSHASVMYNALANNHISKIVQVGIRDFCEQEEQVVTDSMGRVEYYSDMNLQSRLFEGNTWKSICDEITNKLPENIHISFDIDGLDPSLCPNTGTPVPGGLTYQQALYLLNSVAAKRHVIGFDLVEVSPGEDDWNGNVGARLLFHLCGLLHTRK
jgi:agmatinase